MAQMFQWHFLFYTSAHFIKCSYYFFACRFWVGENFWKNAMDRLLNSFRTVSWHTNQMACDVVCQPFISFVTYIGWENAFRYIIPFKYIARILIKSMTYNSAYVIALILNFYVNPTRQIDLIHNTKKLVIILLT